MKLSVNWLLELVDYNKSIAELEDLLIQAGCKVESLETRGVNIDHVVVAEILTSERHPNADRLSVCTVADGMAHPRQIVCGAKNFKVGDKVPLALPGAVLPGNFKIQVGKLRGIESQGMLCSAKELALAEDAVGLLILPPEAQVGAPISSLFPPDSIFDLEITPNRGDWLSHLGIAREVSAFTGGRINCQLPKRPEVASDTSRVKIDDAANCSAYSLRRIRNICVGESPAWLRSKLEAVGCRSVNNVVDITNYIMLLIGQPLHAFDAKQINGDVVVRSAKESEAFQALDGKSYSLKQGDVVIADEQNVLALGGIIGGAASSVLATTTEILLESAVFDPVCIRRTARRLELSTDASYRFERAVDASMMLIASELATQLICELSGGIAETTTFVSGEIETNLPQVTIRHTKVNQLLGLNLEVGVIHDALKRVGLQLISARDESSDWQICGYRRDLVREVDLIEEVARIVGIEAIPERRSAEVVPSTEADDAASFRALLHQRLTAQGFFEARTSTLVNGESFRSFVDESKTIRLKNPLGEDQSFLRPVLIPGLLSAAQRNLNYGQQTVRLYEMGKVFRRSTKEEISSLGIVMTGASASSSWRSKEVHPLDLYDLKGVIQTLIGQPISFVPAQEGTMLSLPVGSLSLQVCTALGEYLGTAGQLSPMQSRELGISGAILVAELLLEPLQILSTKEIRFSQIPRYPSVSRDIAVIVPQSLPYEAIASTLLSAGEPLLHSVAPFDVFTDTTREKLAADRKSIAVSLVFRSSERTLTTEEVAAAEQRLKNQLMIQLRAEFRE